jgi:hypothetical protein
MIARASRAAVTAHRKDDPLTVSVAVAKQVSGLGHTKICELMKNGRLKSTKVDGKRLVNYASLKALVGAQ